MKDIIKFQSPIFGADAQRPCLKLNTFRRTSFNPLFSGLTLKACRSTHRHAPSSKFQSPIFGADAQSNNTTE